MRAAHAPLLLLLLSTACGAPEPLPHAITVSHDGCGSCAVETRVEGLAFELDDGRLALALDVPIERRTAMIELVGIGQGASVEIRYHEVEDGRVLFEGRVEDAQVDLVREHREEARVSGTVAFQAIDPSGNARRFSRIEVRPPNRPVPVEHSGDHGSTQVVVVTTTHHHHDVSGCSGGESYDTGGGCEGDTTSDVGGGCEGDTASDAAASCEGDVAQASAVAGVWRLGWPILTVGAWNRRKRRKLERIA